MTRFAFGKSVQSTKRNSNLPIWVLAGGGVVAFLLVLGAYAMWFRHAQVSSVPEDWSRFGEYIGGVAGTLLALLTLAVLVFTLRVQAEQLDDTRIELGRQSSTLAKQNFESTFFQLVGLIQDRVSRVHEHAEQPTSRGRRGIIGFVHFLNGRDNHRLQIADSPQEAVLQTYRGWHAQNTQEFDWYFRLVYQTLVAIDKAEVDNKQAYADILWATLSPAEKHLLFYHGLTQLVPNPPPLTANDFGTLIKRYRMMPTFDRTQVAVIPEARLAWYDGIPG